MNENAIVQTTLRAADASTVLGSALEGCCVMMGDSFDFDCDEDLAFQPYGLMDETVRATLLKLALED